MKKFIGVFVMMFVFLYSLSGSALATLLYDNGPINGQTDAWTISSGFQVSDSFTLTGTSTLTGAQIGLWISGDTPGSVDWSIGTTYNDNTYGSGTGTLTNTFQYTNGNGGYNIYESIFTLSGTLGAGTYWLTLQNSDPLCYWDMNGGPSQVWESDYGLNPAGYGPSGTANPPSDSFQIYGTSSSVPEPATMLLFGLGLIGVAGIRRKFKG
jgi:hypothetical protein